MNRFLLVGVASAALMIALPQTALAHGGQYLGPRDTVPPNPGGPGTPGPNGPTTPGPTGPSTPGPTGPATPGSSGPATPAPGPAAGPAGGKPVTGRGLRIEEDATSWETWWELNKDAYIRLKEAVQQSGVQTGSDEVYLGPHARVASRDSVKPSDQEIVDQILPALKKALDGTANRDIVSSCMVAMAKIGKNHPDFALLDKVFAPHLTSRDQEVREVAALAIGIAGLTGKSGESLEALRDIALDTPKGRALIAHTEVDDRTRTFATYGLGLIAHATGNVDVKRLAFAALQQLLGDDKLGRSRNLRVATLNAMKLLNVAGQTVEEKTLLADALKALEDYYARDLGPGDQALQAHCPTAIARLLGRDHERTAYYAELFARDLAGRNKKHTANEISQSCALALGQMVKPVDDARARDKDAEYCRLLLDQGRNAKDQQVRYFSYLALGQIGGKANHELLLKEFADVRGQTKAWIALAMGVQVFHRHEAVLVQNGLPEVDRPFGEALKGALLEERNEEVLSAVAVGLGLMQYRDAADAMRERLGKYESHDKLAGYLCIGLALMGDDGSKDEIRSIVDRSVRRPELLRQASIALGKLGDKAVADQLERLLEAGDKNLSRMSAIASALGFIGDRRTIAPLVSLLFDTSLTELSRAFAAVALGGVGDKEMLPWNSKIGANVNYRAAVETLRDQQSGILDIL
jgi:hypothetical protein